MRGPRATLVAALACLAAAGARAQSDEALELHDAGMATHLERRLNEAAAFYDEALALEPPRRPSAAHADLVRRFTPRLFTTSSEPFALRDAAAILHPSRPLIAYHLFWEDDIDFPDDNDPCDHEVIWIEYSADGQTRERTWTYFHGRILEEPRPLSAEPRARVQVQWGKHGSLPRHWERLTIEPAASEIGDGIPFSREPIALPAYMRGSYEKLSTAGRRLPEHPIASRLGWPRRFEGTATDFVTFPREVNAVPLLARPGLVAVSRFNNGTLNRWMLPYNFRPKQEWPDQP